MEVIKEFKVNETVVKIYPDKDPESPREWDNLGTMLYVTGSRHMLGDRSATLDEMEEIANRSDVISLPVYAYIHSGIVMNTTGYSCRWDSGQTGIIYAERSKILEEYGCKRISPQLRSTVEAILRGEVETYSKYVSGEVYGFVIEDASGEELDSCWGFFEEAECEAEARSIAEGLKTQMQAPIPDGWTPIPDVQVRHVWKDEETEKLIYVSPGFYEESGTPICENGDDAVYVRTEIVLAGVQNGE